MEEAHGFDAVEAIVLTPGNVGLMPRKPQVWMPWKPIGLNAMKAHSCDGVSDDSVDVWSSGSPQLPCNSVGNPIGGYHGNHGFDAVEWELSSILLGLMFFSGCAPQT